MNALPHPELRAPPIPADLCRAFEQPVENVGLPPTVLTRPSDLVRRFADFYRPLRALPRRAQRALRQRYGESVAVLALLLALGKAPAFCGDDPGG